MRKARTRYRVGDTVRLNEKQFRKVYSKQKTSTLCKSVGECKVIKVEKTPYFVYCTIRSKKGQKHLISPENILLVKREG